MDDTHEIDGLSDVEALDHLHEPGAYLRLARRTTDPGVLRVLARCEYSFVWQAIARNAAAPLDALAALAPRRHDTWDDNCLLRLLAAHPAVTGEALDGVVELVAERLREGERPFAAVLELARRPELTEERLNRLGHLAGASSRLRRGLSRALAARPSG
ncbi:hypothetical protein ABTY61_25105 [Kitasatospora sp. NPDC096128]|uniref:hypothetical protein n=1 Tax=Kitasatospora sp. NPDC096128 TaxID=3155547 RepID=UPI00331F48B5